jgi:hypothetical protein
MDDGQTDDVESDDYWFSPTFTNLRGTNHAGGFTVNAATRQASRTMLMNVIRPRRNG